MVPDKAPKVIGGDEIAVGARLCRHIKITALIDANIAATIANRTARNANGVA